MFNVFYQKKMNYIFFQTSEVLKISNGIWTPENIRDKFNSTYLAKVDSTYNTDVMTLPPKNPENAVNNWVSKETNGRIKKLVRKYFIIAQFHQLARSFYKSRKLTKNVRLISFSVLSLSYSVISLSLSLSFLCLLLRLSVHRFVCPSVCLSLYLSFVSLLFCPSVHTQSLFNIRLYSYINTNTTNIYS